MLSTWTDGRYVRILAPLGKQVQELERNDGVIVPLAGLSTGTAEQLYLALRFGLVEHFARQAESLPVVMDDILVNFDPVRAERAARSIEDLATRHQVLYFTCHSGHAAQAGEGDRAAAGSPGAEPGLASGEARCGGQAMTLGWCLSSLRSPIQRAGGVIQKPASSLSRDA